MLLTTRTRLARGWAGPAGGEPTARYAVGFNLRDAAVGTRRLGHQDANLGRRDVADGKLPPHEIVAGHGATGNKLPGVAAPILRFEAADADLCVNVIVGVGVLGDEYRSCSVNTSI